MSEKGIKLLVYKEVTPGDLRKLRAKATDADTGRGARDLRFRHESFDPIFARLLPTTVRLPAGRKKTEEVDVRRGPISWKEGSGQRSMDIEYWPPNTARKWEGRWAKVNTISLFQNPPPEDEGRIFVLLIQDEDDAVLLHIGTEVQMRNPGWDQSVVLKILACSDSSRRGALGYLDFEKHDEYCHGQ